MENATSFGKQAATYAKGRPDYPDALHQWIALNSPARDLVWDIGTGSGLVNFTESWSAHFKAREDGLCQALEALSARFLKTHSHKPLNFSLPLSVLAACI